MARRLKERLSAFVDMLEPKPSLEHDILEYHSDQAELERQTVPLSMRLTGYAITAFVLLAVLWASVAKVDRVVVAEGKIVSASPTIVIHPIENSIIQSFEVAVGQIVQAGQVLVKLDSTFSKADEARLRARENSILLQKSRIESELAGEDFQPDAGYDVTEARIQKSLFAGRLQEYRHRLNAYAVTLNELASAVKSLEDQHKESRIQLDILSQIEQIYGGLYRKKTESLAAYLNAKFQKASKISDLAKITNEIQEKKQSVEKAIAEKEAFISNWQNTSLEELSALSAELDAVKEERAKARKIHELSELTAPEKAVVLEFGKYSRGSVARMGEAIMTLVPLDAPLEAEIYIAPSEIGYIRQGDACRIKLTTFPFQKHGTLGGVLRTVGNDSIRPEGAEAPLYVAEVGITESALKNVPDDFQLFPGMSLQAEVKIGQRRIISYFLYPLLRVLDEGLREP